MSDTAEVFSLIKAQEKALKAFFPEDIVRWRIERVGSKDGSLWATAIAYIDARDIQHRLDDVLTAACWSQEYKAVTLGTNSGMLCSLTVQLGCDGTPGSGVFVTKQDGAELTDIESFKGGISKAFVRTAATLGIGRYLYDLEQTFVEISPTKKDGWNYAAASKNQNLPAFYWKTPRLPEWARPKAPAAPLPTSPVTQTPTAQEPPAAAGPTPPGAETAPDALLKDLAREMRRAKWTAEEVNAYVKERYQKESARQCSTQEVTETIFWISCNARP
jgi:hypothetical protein